jgi:hypothetical protein
MPRTSDRSKILKQIEDEVSVLRKRALHRELLDEEDSLQDDHDQYMYAVLNRIKSSRYLFRSSTYRNNRKRFNLEDCLSNDSKEYTDEEFLYNFRITRDSFFLLLKEMENKKPFVKCKYRKQRPISFQLLVFLFRVGKQGACGSSIAVASYFGIGKGSVNNYVRRCISALHEIHNDVVYWPQAEERDEMKARLTATGFRHCVGIIDGTLIVLDSKPEKFHECYYSRKSVYALNVMIVCDDLKRITYYLARWPGSTHDNRVFRNSNLFMNREEFFSHLEYLLGDSAYSASSIMVQSFKKQALVAQLPPDKELFNMFLAQVRIKSEHCIGILKGRFGCLKRNNIQLKSGKKEVKELVRMIGACIVLHNLLINYDEPSVPKEWYNEMRRSIDWSLYDEDQEPIANVGEDGADRRTYVFQSMMNNYRV